MDLLRAMKTFSVIEQDGGFAAAGRRLGLSKAQVSKQLAALETHLGCRLFNRTTRRQSLTEAGHLYLAHSRALLDKNAVMEALLSEEAGEPRGTLRVSAPLSYGQRTLAPIVARFMAGHPGLKLDLALSDRFVDLVAEGYDCAVRIGGTTQSSLIVRKLGEARLGLFASPHYLSRAGTPPDPEALGGHRCLAYGPGSKPNAWPLRSGARTPDWSFKCNDGDMLRRLALEGAGIVHLPEFFIHDDIAQGRLRAVLPGETGAAIPILAVYPHRQLLPLKVRLFIDALAQGLRGERA